MDTYGLDYMDVSVGIDEAGDYYAIIDGEIVVRDTLSEIYNLIDGTDDE